MNPRHTDESISRLYHDVIFIISTQSLVLGNIYAAFSKPAIMDLKIGTVYYDDDASPEKKARKMAEAAQTTALETGAKITGFQVGLKFAVSFVDDAKICSDL